MADRQRLLLVSPDIQDEKAPRRTAYASAADGYALSLSALPGYYAAAIAAPNSYVIDVLDSTTLVRVQTLPGHDIATSSLQTANNVGGTGQKCLVSSGKDGSIMSWDLRTNAPSIKCTPRVLSRRRVLTTHQLTAFASDQPRQEASAAVLRYHAGWNDCRGRYGSEHKNGGGVYCVLVGGVHLHGITWLNCNAGIRVNPRLRCGATTRRTRTTLRRCHSGLRGIQRRTAT